MFLFRNKDPNMPHKLYYTDSYPGQHLIILRFHPHMDFIICILSIFTFISIPPFIIDQPSRPYFMLAGFKDFLSHFPTSQKLNTDFVSGRPFYYIGIIKYLFSFAIPVMQGSVLLTCKWKCMAASALLATMSVLTHSFML